MSVVNKLKNIFSKKNSESELDSRLSLAMPDGDGDAPETNAMDFVNTQETSGLANIRSEDEKHPINQADQITLPLLGSKTVAQHQRFLSMLLGGGLVVLAGVTFFVLGQSNQVAQQLGATGCSRSVLQNQCRWRWWAMKKHFLMYLRAPVSWLNRCGVCKMAMIH